jgi:hypothetical protein
LSDCRANSCSLKSVYTKNNFRLLFILNSRKNYRGGHLPVYLRISVSGKGAEITSGLECDPERWNTKSGDSMEMKDGRSFNAYLDNLQSMINKIYRDLFDAGEVITSAGIKCKFIWRDVRKYTWVEVTKIRE